MVADGDTVAVFGSEHFLVKRTGKEWVVDWVQVHEVRDGRRVSETHRHSRDRGSLFLTALRGPN